MTPRLYIGDRVFLADIPLETDGTVVDIVNSDVIRVFWREHPKKIETASYSPNRLRRE